MEKIQTQAPQNQEVEIDLGQIFRAIAKRWYILVICALIGAALAFGYTKFLVTPQYKSTASMLVLTKETTLTSLADLQIGSQLTGDYTQLIKSPDVLTETITDLSLDLTYRELGSKVSINNPASTRILELTVTDPDPQKAMDIVNTLAENASAYISDVMEVSPPKVFSLGEVASNPSSPNTSRNMAIGLILGVIVAIIIVAVRSLMDDTIRTEEDVENYLGLTVLASIPDRAQVKGGQGYYGYGYGESEK